MAAFLIESASHVSLTSISREFLTITEKCGCSFPQFLSLIKVFLFCFIFAIYLFPRREKMGTMYRDALTKEKDFLFS